MNDQMKNFKKDMRQKLIEKENLAKGKLNFNILYNETKNQLSQIAHQIKHLKESEEKEKAKLTH